MIAKVLSPSDGERGWLGSTGVRFMIGEADTAKRFALVEHPMAPRALAAPLHRHSREDEYSYVLAGRMGSLLGDEVVFAKAGDLVFKPRNQWHTFWNAGDEPASILEIISPAGFERYFGELSDLLAGGKMQSSDLADLCSKYGLEMKPESVSELMQRFQVRFP